MDDEPIVCDSIRMLLSFDGHSVQTAKNAEEALQRFDPSAVDVLITDYAMPVMRGDELATNIKQLAPSQRILMITGSSEMYGGFKAPVDACLGKPFGFQDLRRAIAELVG